MSEANAYSCIIVDDDEIDRLTTLSFVKKYPFLSVKGVYDNAAAALAEIEQTRPHILLLDVDMDGTNGLELRRQLLQVDACIFITSYPDYALESFELAALDFLVKPVKTDRFAASMQRLEEYLLLRKKSALLDHSLNGDTIFIKDGHEHIKIKAADILYLEALKDYTGIITRQKKHCVLASLGNLLKDPSFSSFIRVHRSYAVQKHFIDKITPQEIHISGISIPVGRSYKKALEKIIM
ncbi:LytR/AlgR family response regulator transcription factor [Niabella drilacis]|uniref:Two component transcriptional regulator, LytTR family n=1 Tax=Niabella drilacis (strain DSM 25811 / CCM 8410 / CCUG 62505 / LMG 26954 / E90) TaxID=1285928 RepID=A0A1G6QCX6_NIADE|nr:LytTR family DNA-binding domain-containing protein [Niabella drilacis]SDC89525.1 two component transcriptional regulator, LytTR family [Niabella drilacis]